MHPKHYSIPNGIFFLSVHCVSGLKPFCNDDICRVFLKLLKEKTDDFKIRLFAYVVMPDHIHLLLQQPEQQTLQKIMNHINGASARAINNAIGTTGNKFWQGGFHDVYVREPADFGIKINYIHNNPVKAELVVHPEDYNFSSAEFYNEKFGTAIFNTAKFDAYSLESISVQCNDILRSP
jgi:putative transposase